MGHPVVGASAPAGYHVVAVPNEGAGSGAGAGLAEFRTGGFVISAARKGC